MSGRKISKRYFLVFFLVFSLVFSPINFAFFQEAPFAEAADVVIGADTEWSGMQTVSGYAYIDFGVTLTIKKGSVIEFEGQSILDVAGSLVVEGTPSEPVIFRKKNNDNSDDYYAIIASSGKVYARNIDVSGGGSASEAFMVKRNREHSISQHANAEWMYSGAFDMQGGGILDIEGANFHDNVLALHKDRYSSMTPKVWRSKFSNNTWDLINESGSGVSDMRYNWWGNTSGPEVCVSECGGYYQRPYQKIIGKVNFAEWAKESDFKDPVVVVPGIMGSWKMTQSSDLELDPALGTYDALLETLDKNGYTTGENLFPFPYEWHYSNVESAKLLKTKIDEVKIKTKWPKVDIVAHSMGGLVAREYIGTLNGGSNVDQLVTIGTPHEGSPKSYLTWEGGDFGVKLRDFLLEIIFQQEAEENGYASIFEYIRETPIVSVRELLPTYSYLRDKESGVLRTYPDLYPMNTFLQNLKTPTNINRLAPVIFTNIVGKTNSGDTIEKIRVDGASVELLSDPEAAILWGYGKPDGYDNLLGGDRGLELGIGDGTVPLESAKGIVSDETIELPSDHGALPADAAKTVFRTLTGIDATSGASFIPPTSLLLFMPFSPIDIQIISPSEKRMGKNFETGGVYDEIPGAYYTGYDTQNEFITVPNPEDGEYTILTQGTGDGAYRVEAVKITEGATPGDEAKESVATFAGTATPGATEEKKIELLADDTVILKEDKDIIAPTISIASPENKSYLNNQLLSIAYTVTDNTSPEEKITKEARLDDAAFDQTTIDLSLQPLGNHIFSIQATDEAGNEAMQSASFENTVTFASLNANILHYKDLGLIKKKEDVRHIQAYLRYFEKLREFISRLEQIRYFPPQAKARLLRHLERASEHKQEEFVSYLEQRVEKGVVDTQAKDRIVEAVAMLVE